MANIYDEIKSLVSSDLTSKMAKEIGAGASHVTDATHLIIPTLLAKFMGKSDSQQVHNVVEDAGKGLLHEVKNISHETGSKHVSIGDKFVNAIMGNQSSALASMVAAKDGMSVDHAKKLITSLGAVLAGFLGNKVINHGGGHQLLEQLRAEKNSILAGVPAEWRDKIGITNEGMHCNAPHPAAQKTAAHATHHATPHVSTNPAPKKKGGAGWLLWLLLAILLCLLLWWLLGRGCSKRRVVEKAVTEVVAPVKNVATAAASAASNIYELALASGEKLSVTKGSHVDDLVTYLRSDKYKNATDADLQKHWFEFKDVDFKYNSSTEFEGNSLSNLRDIAYVMKYFPDTKIRIGGKADAKGGNPVNMNLSRARAETIKKHIIDAGVQASRISTEGFGKELAVIPATATDAERAPDRDFAMRFMK